MSAEVVPFQQPPPALVRDVVDLYLVAAERKLKPTTLVSVLSVLSRFRHAHGHLPLTGCIPHQLESWIESHPEWDSDWTRGRVNRTVQRAFNWAVKGRLIGENPFRGVSYGQGGCGQPMTDDEFAKLIGRAPELFRDVLWFLRLTGCRPKELSELRWEHVDADQMLIVLWEHKTVRMQRTPKPRLVPITDRLGELLLSIRDRQEPASDHVFLNSKHRPWQRRALCARLQRLREALGLRDECKLYGLRHKLGTDSILAGNDLKTTAELLGHSTTRVTERYTHVAGQGEHLRKAMTRATGG